MIAGIPNSEHLIDMCELKPPYLVIKPLILWLKIKSNPGSAFSIHTILFEILIFLLSSSEVRFPSHSLLVI